MRFFDAHQFRQAVKEGDVSGGQVTAGHQVVENAADVDHHFAGRLLLVPVGRELGHQAVHRFCGCTTQEYSGWNQTPPNENARCCSSPHSHMSFLSLACRDIFRRKPVRERSSRSLLVRRRSRMTGSMRSCSIATRLSTEAHCRTARSDGVQSTFTSSCQGYELLCLRACLPP